MNAWFGNPPVDAADTIYDAERRVAERYRHEYPATFEEALDVLPARAYAEADARINALLAEAFTATPWRFADMTIDVAELRAAGRRPRVHGNGFIQLDLNDAGTRRLHVWHDAIPRQVVATPIHDHVFDMRSTVLTGTLVHEELEPRSSEYGTHKVYTAQQAAGTQNTILVPDAGLVSLDVVQRLVLGAGSIYTFPAGKLHTSGHHGLTATIMEKVNAPGDYGRPRVLVTFGEEPDNDFHRDGFAEDTLWPFIEDVADALYV